MHLEIIRPDLVTGTARPALLVVLREGAHVGLGEASPLPGYSADTLAQCERGLSAAADALGPLGSGSALEQTVAAMHRAGPALAASPSARFAVETALLDALSHRDGVPVSHTLAGRRLQQRVPRGGVLERSVPFECYPSAVRALLARGIRTIKIKIGRRDTAFACELAALHTLRREVTEPFTLRLDANGAWDLDQARRRLDALAPCAPEFVEEPVAGPALLALGSSAVPWAADESLALPDLADRLLDAPGCRAVVLKPALLGGALPALDLAQRAHERGLGVVVSHMFDGPVALAAACAVALALPGGTLACGLDEHTNLRGWPAIGLQYLAEPGWIVSGNRSGLGVDPGDLGVG